MSRRLLIAVGLLALFAGLVAWFMQPPSRARFDAAVVAEKAAGRPVTFEELAGAIPPDAENGFADLVAAANWLQSTKGSESAWTVAGPWNPNTLDDWYETESPERLAELELFLAEAQPYFDRVAAAVTKPRCVAPAEVGWDPISIDNHIPRLQAMARVLQARALADADARDRLEAMRLLAALARRDVPHTVIGVMVDCAVMSAALKAVRHDVERGEIDAKAARAELLPGFERHWLAEFACLVRAQRVYLVELGRLVASGADLEQLFSVPSMPLRAPRTSGLKRVADEIQRILKGKRAPSPNDFADALGALRPLLDLQSDSYPALASAVEALKTSLAGDEFASGEMSLHSRMPKVLATLDAKQSLAAIALAALEHRATRGALPASLDDLAWAFPDGVPLDPFTERPFEFALDANGLRIASAGRLASEAPVAEADLGEYGLVWRVPK